MNESGSPRKWLYICTVSPRATRVSSPRTKLASVSVITRLRSRSLIGSRITRSSSWSITASTAFMSASGFRSTVTWKMPEKPWLCWPTDHVLGPLLLVHQDLVQPPGARPPQHAGQDVQLGVPGRERLGRVPGVVHPAQLGELVVHHLALGGGDRGGRHRPARRSGGLGEAAEPLLHQLLGLGRTSMSPAISRVAFDGHVPLAEEVLHVLQRGVGQILVPADGQVAVGVALGVQQPVQRRSVPCRRGRCRSSAGARCGPRRAGWPGSSRSAAAACSPCGRSPATARSPAGATGPARSSWCDRCWWCR